MLNEADIEFMKSTRKELVRNRQAQVIIKYPGEVVIDDISGEVIGGETLSREVLSVVTEISSAAAIERVLINGVEVERGDVKVDISYELIDDIVTEIDEVRYDDRDYAVLASDKKGIGGFNRIEVIARLIT